MTNGRNCRRVDDNARHPYRTGVHVGDERRRDRRPQQRAARQVRAELFEDDGGLDGATAEAPALGRDEQPEDTHLRKRRPGCRGRLRLSSTNRGEVEVTLAERLDRVAKGKLLFVETEIHPVVPSPNRAVTVAKDLDVFPGRRVASRSSKGRCSCPTNCDRSTPTTTTTRRSTRSPATSTRSSGTAACRSCSDGTHVEMLIGGKGQPLHPEPDLRPGDRARMPRPAVPRPDPRGRRPARRCTRVEPISAEYRDRDARLAKMDEQGLDAALLFPTLGCGVEQALTHDIPATMASLSAFNRWLDDDWGFSYRDRIIAAPMISLADPEAAIAEIDCVARARRAHRARASRSGAHGWPTRAGRSATRSTTRCGPGSPRPTFPSRSTSATAATTRCSARRGAAPRTSRRSANPTCSARSSSATARSTTRWRA